jgi:RNA polymerase sigma factor (TIGR02999 family)
MSSVTRFITEMQNRSDHSAGELFGLVYDELRLVARKLMAKERGNHTLDPTALVHEVYMRLSRGKSKPWKSRAYFFSAAAEAMRRILVDHARRRNAQRHGGGREHADVIYSEVVDAHVSNMEAVDLLTLDDALDRLAADYPAKAELVKLLYFAGLSLEEVAAIQGTSRTSVYRQWLFARAWLRRFITRSEHT